MSKPNETVASRTFEAFVAHDMLNPITVVEAPFAQELEDEITTRGMEIAAKQEVVDSLRQQLEATKQELVEARKSLASYTKAKELVHKSFGFIPHRDDPKKCNCAYCARDFEAVAEHAAMMEVERFSDDQKLVAQQHHIASLALDNAKLREAMSNALTRCSVHDSVTNIASELKCFHSTTPPANTLRDWVKLAQMASVVTELTNFKQVEMLKDKATQLLQSVGEK